MNYFFSTSFTAGVRHAFNRDENLTSMRRFLFFVEVNVVLKNLNENIYNSSLHENEEVKRLNQLCIFSLNQKETAPQF